MKCYGSFWEKIDFLLLTESNVHDYKAKYIQDFTEKRGYTALLYQKTRRGCGAIKKFLKIYPNMLAISARIRYYKIEL